MKETIEQSLAPYGAQQVAPRLMCNPYGIWLPETLCAPSGEP